MQVDDEDGNWPRQLLFAVGALVAAAVVVGGIASVVALAAADFAGVGSDNSGASQAPSVYIPPPASPSSTPNPPQDSQPPQQGVTDRPEQPDKPEQKKPRITLTASPKAASAGSRIDLRGSYRGGNGTNLRVQRFEGGGWVDFPVSATVRGGRFETWVQSGQEGKNRFRVVDQGTGRRSQPVTVTLR